jgi:putative NIF3 family GTP cyclohydrolase 1 type 2
MLPTGRCPALAHALRALESVASTRLAAKWDNVGLLVDATRRFGGGKPYRVFFTNDLTPAVLSEAVAAAANLIVTYHPTPFTGLKKFSADTPAASVVLTCAANGIAVYSPHTALDVVRGGINEWLVTGIAGALPRGAVPVSMHPVKPAEDPAAAASGVGDGRIGVFAAGAGVTLRDVVDAVKAHLKLPTVAVALPSTLLGAVAAGRDSVLAAAAGVPVDSFAVCAGSGASVLAGCRASVWVTGELSHHEVRQEGRRGGCFPCGLCLCGRTVF